MKLHEITNTKPVEQMDEGWKDWALAAGVGSMALGGGNAAWDAYKTSKEQAAGSASRTYSGQVTAPSIAKTLLGSTKNKMEQVLIKAAHAAGLDNTELKQFLAQCAHESMNFTRLTEMGSNKYFARLYDIKHNPAKAKELGNLYPGDGARYKGRGFIQLTGRYNYARAGAALGLPLEENPELVERPDVAAKVSLWFWKHRVQPRVDDFSDTPAATKPINSGLKGLKDREAHFDRYASLVGAKPKTN